MSDIDRITNTPDRAISQLEAQAKPFVRSTLVTEQNRPLLAEDALPVHAGGSIIRKGMLTRLPAARDYDARTSVTDKDTNFIKFEGISPRARSLSSGIIIGGKMSRQAVATQNVWFRLWLYLANPGPFLNLPQVMDGRPFNVSWSRRDIRIGYLDFNNFDAGQDCSESPALVSVGQNLLFELKEANLYGLLEARSSIPMLASEECDLYLYITAD